MYFTLPEYIHFEFKNRCRFYDLSYQEVFSLMVEKFINGEFDTELGIGDLVDERDKGYSKSPGGSR